MVLKGKTGGSSWPQNRSLSCHEILKLWSWRSPRNIIEKLKSANKCLIKYRDFFRFNATYNLSLQIFSKMIFSIIKKENENSEISCKPSKLLFLCFRGKFVYHFELLLTKEENKQFSLYLGAVSIVWSAGPPSGNLSVWEKGGDRHQHMVSSTVSCFNG